MIRPAQRSDLEHLFEIVVRAIAAMEEQGIYQWDSHYPTPDDLKLDLDQNALYVMADENRCFGFVTLNQHQEPEYADIDWVSGGPALVVHRLTIDPLHQGRGRATQLMSFIETHAVHAGYSSIRLDAFVHNPVACRLYERCGYTYRGEVRFRKGLFRCYEMIL